jgi:hypothetical protein
MSSVVVTVASSHRPTRPEMTRLAMKMLSESCSRSRRDQMSSSHYDGSRHLHCPVAASWRRAGGFTRSSAEPIVVDMFPDGDP